MDEKQKTNKSLLNKDQTVGKEGQIPPTFASSSLFTRFNFPWLNFPERVPPGLNLILNCVTQSSKACLLSSFSRGQSKPRHSSGRRGNFIFETTRSSRGRTSNISEQGIFTGNKRQSCLAIVLIKFQTIEILRIIREKLFRRAF